MSRRSALAGLGAGSLGLAFASQFAAASTGHSTSVALADHPLTGLWLSMVGLPSNRDVSVVVPTIFGTDGSMVLIYPCTENSETGVQIKGAAIGTWAPVDGRSGHFTTVQVLSDIDGNFLGTITLDGHPVVSDDNETYTVDSNFDLVTIRDSFNAVTRSMAGPSRNPMHAYRMRPGNAGFPASVVAEEPTLVRPPAPVDPRTPD
jgi:hypothetical protein